MSIWLLNYCLLPLFAWHLNTAMWEDGIKNGWGRSSWCVWFKEGGRHVSVHRLAVSLPLSLQNPSVSDGKQTVSLLAQSRRGKKSKRYGVPSDWVVTRREGAQICQPSRAVPVCHLSLSLQMCKKTNKQKKKVTFLLPGTKKQYIAMILEITIRRKEHFSQPDWAPPTPPAVLSYSSWPCISLRSYSEALAWANPTPTKSLSWSEKNKN